MKPNYHKQFESFEDDFNDAQFLLSLARCTEQEDYDGSQEDAQRLREIAQKLLRD